MSVEYEEFKKLMSRKKYREAAAFAEEQYALEKNLFWITQQAFVFIRAGTYENALERAQEVLILDSHNPYALITAADALRGLKRYNEALEYYKEAQSRDRVRARAEKGICECLEQLKKWQSLFDFCVTLPGQADDYILYKIKALKALGKTEQALEECREALNRKPDNPPLLWEQTELEIEHLGIEQVIEQMGRLAKIKTLPPVYKEIYASICRRAGKHERALQTYETLETGVQDIRIQRKKAFTLANTGHEEEAIPMFEEFLKLNPKDMYVHASYGPACVRIGEAERGINFYHTLLSLFPDEKGIYGYINRLKKKAGKK